MGPLTVLAACAYESHEDTLKDVTVQLPLQALLWKEARAVVSPIHFSSPNYFFFLLGSHSADVAVTLHPTYCRRGRKALDVDAPTRNLESTRQIERLLRAVAEGEEAHFRQKSQGSPLSSKFFLVPGFLAILPLLLLLFCSSFVL